MTERTLMKRPTDDELRQRFMMSPLAAVRMMQAYADHLGSTNARLVEALTACVAAARYYEREKPGWCPNDDAHDDAIEAAEKQLATGGEKGGADD
jgi:hypothetical protein